MDELDENYIYIHIYISNITQQIEISSHTLNRIISENEMVVSNNNSLKRINFSLCLTRG